MRERRSPAAALDALERAIALALAAPALGPEAREELTTLLGEARRLRQAPPTNPESFEAAVEELQRRAAEASLRALVVAAVQGNPPRGLSEGAWTAWVWSAFAALAVTICITFYCTLS